MKVISASLAKWKFKIQIKIWTEIQREIRIAYKCSHMKVVKASKLSVTITLEWSGHIYPLSSENGKHKYIQCEVFVFGISLLIIQTIQPPREEQKIHWSFDIYSNESALSCDLWYVHSLCLLQSPDIFARGIAPGVPPNLVSPPWIQLFTFVTQSQMNTSPSAI